MSAWSSVLGNIWREGREERGREGRKEEREGRKREREREGGHI